MRELQRGGLRWEGSSSTQCVAAGQDGLLDKTTLREWAKSKSNSDSSRIDTLAAAYFGSKLGDVTSSGGAAALGALVWSLRWRPYSDKRSRSYALAQVRSWMISAMFHFSICLHMVNIFHRPCSASGSEPHVTRLSPASVRRMSVNSGTHRGAFVSKQSRILGMRPVDCFPENLHYFKIGELIHCTSDPSSFVAPLFVAHRS